MLYEFKGLRPYVHESAFVHPQANVTGLVEIYEDVYIGPGAVIRGDWGKLSLKQVQTCKKIVLFICFLELLLLLKREHT